MNAHDPYLDPETGILRNLVGARTQSELDTAEADLTAVRAIELIDRQSIQASGDLHELLGIHRALFKDVYEWAGEVRTINMRKNFDGAEFFLPQVMIQRAAGFAADALRADNMLRGLDRDRFVDRLAYHYDQFNYIHHPTREGNGRTGRLFWDRISGDAGYTLDWRMVAGRENDHASRTASEQRNLAPLRTMLDRITAPLERDHSDRDARLQRLALHRRPHERDDPELGFDR